ncbi:MAG: MFS transporter [Chloroflexota bacterium]
MTASSAASVGYVQLIRGNRNFRNLWIGQVISLLGDWFNLIASASLIATLTGSSGLAVGTLLVVRMLAPFAISPIAGVVADRYNRKWILVISDLLRGVAVLGFLFVQDVSQIWLLYVLTAVQLGLSGFFHPTRDAILPDIVAPEEVGTANALSASTWSVMLALGAALGGLVAGLWGVRTAFIIDALTFLLSAFFIYLVSLEVKPTPKADQTVTAALQEYLDGLRYLGKYKDVLVTVLHKVAIMLILGSAFDVIQVLVSTDVYNGGWGSDVNLGLMYMMTGIGTGIGPLIIRPFVGDELPRVRRAILVGYLLGIVGMLTIAPFGGFLIFLFGMLIRGLGIGLIWVFSTQLLLQLVPSEVRGRVFATEFALFTLGGAIGAWVSGGVLDLVPTLSTIIWVLAVLWLVPTFLWYLWIRRHGATTPSIATE